MARLQNDGQDSSDWQLAHTGLLQRTRYLLESELWSDCTFLLGSEEEVVMAHKVVLSIASPVFAAMFYGEVPQEEVVHIPDVQPDVFRALLRYLYTDTFSLNMDPSDISDPEKVIEFLFGVFYGAKKYMLPHLEKQCIEYLMAKLSPNIVCRVYDFAYFFEENGLMEKCLEIITRNTKEVLNADSFENAELHTVVTIFSLDHLDIGSELELCDAAARYSKAFEKRTSRERAVALPLPIKNPASNAENRLDTKEKDKLTIRTLIEKIRFLTLTPEQFAEGPGQSTLLSESDAFAVLMNLTSSKVTHTPMPSGFSTSRAFRNFIQPSLSSNFIRPSIVSFYDPDEVRLKRMPY